MFASLHLKSRSNGMDKIILSRKDIEFVLKWRNEHKDLVRVGVNPLRAVKIICTDSGITLTAINDGTVLSIGINQSGKSLGRIEFRPIANGMFQKIKDKAKISEENKQSVLTVYISVMALLVFGRSTIKTPEPKEAKTASYPKKLTKRSKKCKTSGVTYILTYSGKEPRIGIKGSHGSPQGIFSVRGHYRRCKSGKVIWIAQYTKGTGKKTDKSYRIGRID